MFRYISNYLIRTIPHDSAQFRTLFRTLFRTVLCGFVRTNISDFLAFLHDSARFARFAHFFLNRFTTFPMLGISNIRYIRAYPFP